MTPTVRRTSLRRRSRSTTVTPNTTGNPSKTCRRKRSTSGTRVSISSLKLNPDSADTKKHQALRLSHGWLANKSRLCEMPEDESGVPYSPSASLFYNASQNVAIDSVLTTSPTSPLDATCAHSTPMYLDASTSQKTMKPHRIELNLTENGEENIRPIYHNSSSSLANNTLTNASSASNENTLIQQSMSSTLNALEVTTQMFPGPTSHATKETPLKTSDSVVSSPLYGTRITMKTPPSFNVDPQKHVLIKNTRGRLMKISPGKNTPNSPSVDENSPSVYATADSNRGSIFDKAELTHDIPTSKSSPHTGIRGEEISSSSRTCRGKVVHNKDEFADCVKYPHSLSLGGKNEDRTFSFISPQSLRSTLKRSSMFDSNKVKICSRKSALGRRSSLPIESKFLRNVTERVKGRVLRSSAFQSELGDEGSLLSEIDGGNYALTNSELLVSLDSTPDSKCDLSVEYVSGQESYHQNSKLNSFKSSNLEETPGILRTRLTTTTNPKLSGVKNKSVGFKVIRSPLTSLRKAKFRRSKGLDSSMENLPDLPTTRKAPVPGLKPICMSTYTPDVGRRKQVSFCLPQTPKNKKSNIFDVETPTSDPSMCVSPFTPSVYDGQSPLYKLQHLRITTTGSRNHLLPLRSGFQKRSRLGLRMSTPFKDKQDCPMSQTPGMSPKLLLGTSQLNEISEIPAQNKSQCFNSVIKSNIPKKIATRISTPFAKRLPDSPVAENSNITVNESVKASSALENSRSHIAKNLDAEPKLNSITNSSCRKRSHLGSNIKMPFASRNHGTSSPHSSGMKTSQSRFIKNPNSSRLNKQTLSRNRLPVDNKYKVSPCKVVLALNETDPSAMSLISKSFASETKKNHLTRSFLKKRNRKVSISKQNTPNILHPTVKSHDCSSRSQLKYRDCHSSSKKLMVKPVKRLTSKRLLPKFEAIRDDTAKDGKNLDGSNIMDSKGISSMLRSMESRGIDQNVVFPNENSFNEVVPPQKDVSLTANSAQNSVLNIKVSPKVISSSIPIINIQMPSPTLASSGDLKLRKSSQRCTRQSLTKSPFDFRPSVKMLFDTSEVDFSDLNSTFDVEDFERTAVKDVTPSKKKRGSSTFEIEASKNSISTSSFKVLNSIESKASTQADLRKRASTAGSTTAYTSLRRSRTELVLHENSCIMNPRVGFAHRPNNEMDMQAKTSVKRKSIVSQANNVSTTSKLGSVPICEKSVANLSSEFPNHTPANNTSQKFDSTMEFEKLESLLSGRNPSNKFVSTPETVRRTPRIILSNIAKSNTRMSDPKVKIIKQSYASEKIDRVTPANPLFFNDSIMNKKECSDIVSNGQNNETFDSNLSNSIVLSDNQTAQPSTVCYKFNSGKVQVQDLKSDSPYPQSQKTGLSLGKETQFSSKDKVLSRQSSSLKFESPIHAKKSSTPIRSKVNAVSSTPANSAMVVSDFNTSGTLDVSEYQLECSENNNNNTNHNSKISNFARNSVEDSERRLTRNSVLLLNDDSPLKNFGNQSHVAPSTPFINTVTNPTSAPSVNFGHSFVSEVETPRIADALPKKSAGSGISSFSCGDTVLIHDSTIELKDAKVVNETPKKYLRSNSSKLEKIRESDLVLQGIKSPQKFVEKNVSKSFNTSDRCIHDSPSKKLVETPIKPGKYKCRGIVKGGSKRTSLGNENNNRSVRKKLNASLDIVIGQYIPSTENNSTNKDVSSHLDTSSAVIGSPDKLVTPCQLEPTSLSCSVKTYSCRSSSHSSSNDSHKLVADFLFEPTPLYNSKKNYSRRSRKTLSKTEANMISDTSNLDDISSLRFSQLYKETPETIVNEFRNKVTPCVGSLNTPSLIKFTPDVLSSSSDREGDMNKKTSGSSKRFENRGLINDVILEDKEEESSVATPKKKKSNNASTSQVKYLFRSGIKNFANSTPISNNYGSESKTQQSTKSFVENERKNLFSLDLEATTNEIVRNNSVLALKELASNQDQKANNVPIKGPKVVKEHIADYTNVEGLKRLLNPAGNSPISNYNNLEGVSTMFTSPATSRKESNQKKQPERRMKKLSKLVSTGRKTRSQQASSSAEKITPTKNICENALRSSKGHNVLSGTTKFDDFSVDQPVINVSEDPEPKSVKKSLGSSSKKKAARYSVKKRSSMKKKSNSKKRVQFNIKSLSPLKPSPQPDVSKKRVSKRQLQKLQEHSVGFQTKKSSSLSKSNEDTVADDMENISQPSPSANRKVDALSTRNTRSGRKTKTATVNCDSEALYSSPTASAGSSTVAENGKNQIIDERNTRSRRSKKLPVGLMMDTELETGIPVENAQVLPTRKSSRKSAASSKVAKKTKRDSIQKLSTKRRNLKTGAISEFTEASSSSDTAEDSEETVGVSSDSAPKSKRERYTRKGASASKAVTQISGNTRINASESKAETEISGVATSKSATSIDSKKANRKTIAGFKTDIKRDDTITPKEQSEGNDIPRMTRIKTAISKEGETSSEQNVGTSKDTAPIIATKKPNRKTIAASKSEVKSRGQGKHVESESTSQSLLVNDSAPVRRNTRKTVAACSFKNVTAQEQCGDSLVSAMPIRRQRRNLAPEAPGSQTLTSQHLNDGPCDSSSKKGKISTSAKVKSADKMDPIDEHSEENEDSAEETGALTNTCKIKVPSKRAIKKNKIIRKSLAKNSSKVEMTPSTSSAVPQKRGGKRGAALPTTLSSPKKLRSKKSFGTKTGEGLLKKINEASAAKRKSIGKKKRAKSVANVSVDSIKEIVRPTRACRSKKM